MLAHFSTDLLVSTALSTLSTPANKSSCYTLPPLHPFYPFRAQHLGHSIILFWYWTPGSPLTLWDGGLPIICAVLLAPFPNTTP